MKPGEVVQLWQHAKRTTEAMLSLKGVERLIPIERHKVSALDGMLDGMMSRPLYLNTRLQDNAMKNGGVLISFQCFVRRSLA